PAVRVDPTAARGRPAAASFQRIGEEPHAWCALRTEGFQGGTRRTAEIPRRVREGGQMNYLASQLQTWTHAPFAKALGWSLIHFLWEGLLLALLLALLLYLS